MSEEINFIAKSEFVHNSSKGAYSRIPDAQLWFFVTQDKIKKFMVESFLDRDKYEGQSSLNLVWVKEFIL